MQGLQGLRRGSLAQMSTEGISITLGSNFWFYGHHLHKYEPIAIMNFKCGTQKDSRVS